jgi:hypothetical protein
MSTMVAITLYISPLLTTILADEPSAPLGLAVNSISNALGYMNLILSWKIRHC